MKEEEQKGDIFTELQVQKVEEVVANEEVLAGSMPSAQVKSVFMIDKSKLTKATN